MLDQSFIEALDGESGCKRLAQDFYARVANDKDLKPLFPGKSVRCATEEFAAFLIQFLDGDENQTQYRWWLSLRESHARFKISERQRLAWLRLMDETIHSLFTDAATQQALVQFFHTISVYVVGNGEADVKHSELSERWSQQRALDQLIDHIANGRDVEAIGLASQFGSRPSVCVGSLARFMETGREPLIEFARTSIQNHAPLAKSRFNGRTLLHFAAASSCLPVVQQLLSGGVDPDVLDGGKHTPLYRAASSEIVKELVRAGATVDHCGGVNKSTPLHQAARYGRLEVARALLDAGASRTAKDKKGFTPLDRAINCRKREVAELLASRP